MVGRDPAWAEGRWTMDAERAREPSRQEGPPAGLGERLAFAVRVRWAFALGAFGYALAVLALLDGTPPGGALPAPVFLAGLPLLVVAQNLAAGWCARHPRWQGAGTFLSVAGDLAAVTVGLHGTGGVASWLWAVYPLVVLEAAYLTRAARRTAAAAVAGVAAYALVQAAERLGWLPPVMTAYTVAEQGRPLPYLAAKVGWVALLCVAAGFAGHAALAALDAARARLEEAYARLQRQHQALRELDRLKGDFLSVVAHELRTPLTIAGGYAELAEDDPGLTDEGRAYLAATTRAIAGLAANVDLMIAYAGLADGHERLRREPLRATDVVEQVFEGQEAACREAGLVLMRDEPREDLRLEGDPARLAAALGELVENARRATPAGGTVGLGARAEGEAIAFEVWDTGPGIPARVRGRIGEAFLQPEDVLTEHAPGLGLGLAYAHLVAARHAGALEVRDRPGGGALVRLVVPTGAGAVRSPAPGAGTRGFP